MSKIWEKEEMILALDFYITHRPKLPDQNSEELKFLLINIHKIQKSFGHEEKDYRTIDSLYLRSSNYLSVDPTDTRLGMSGGQTKCQPIWDEFSHNWDHLHKLSEQIKNFTSDNLDVNYDLVFDDVAIAKEGKLVTYKHLKRERNAKIVKEKKKYLKE